MCLVNLGDTNINWPDLDFVFGLINCKKKVISPSSLATNVPTDSILKEYWTLKLQLIVQNIQPYNSPRHFIYVQVHEENIHFTSP